MKNKDGSGRLKTYIDVNCSKNGNEAINMCNIFMANA
jgi:hypothetical protein